MDDIDIYLDSALKKDVKLCKFIQGTLENGPASDSDEQDGENRDESLSFMPSTSSDPPATETDYGSSSVKRAPAEMNQSFACDPFDTSSFEVSITDDDMPDLILHFAEINDFERDCVSAHVKRLKRELEESAKRKEKRHEQPKQRQFTGKPIDAGNSVRRAMKPKPRRRQCKKPYGLGKKANNA